MFILILASIVVNINVYAQSINIHSITTTRMSGGDNGYTLNGSHMNSSSAPKLWRTINFSATGTYPKKVSIINGYGNSNDLAGISNVGNIDLFFFGGFEKNNSSLIQFTNAELDSLYNWSMNGGKMIIYSAASNNPSFNADFDILNSRWRFDVSNQGNTLINPTSAGLASLIFNGPFGSVSSANQGGSIQGYFNLTPANSIILGEDGSGKPTLLLDCNTLDLIIADGDAYNDLGNVTGGPTISSQNDIFWANTIAYMDTLESQPVITQNGDSLFVGAYGSYQWFMNGDSILGATSSSYKMVANGSYYVEVSLDCGCDNVGSNVISSNNVGINESSPLFAQFSVYPNPVSARGVVSFNLKQSENVSVGIYDLSGKEIQNLFQGNLLSGEHQFNLNMKINSNLVVPHGMYLVKISGETNFETRKFILAN